MDEFNESEKQSRKRDYDKKQAKRRTMKEKESVRNNKDMKYLSNKLRQELKNLKPESGALDFQSSILSTAFGPKNLVFFSSFVSALSTSTSWQNTISIVTMYLSQVLNSEAVNFLLEEVESLRVKPEAGLEDIWMTAKSVSGIFTRFKNTEIFKRLRDLVTLCVVSGLVDTKSSSFTAKSLALFSVKSSANIANPGDLLDLIMRTIVYFAESGYRLFSTRNPEFLFEPVDLMADFQKVVEYWPICKTGNLMRIHGMDSRDFGNLLSTTQKNLCGAINESYGPEKALYLRMSNQLSLIKSEYLQCKTDGKLRQAPIVIMIIGDSSVGKSTISNMMIIAVLKAMGRPCTPDRIRSWNASDAYDSWADGNTEGLLADDMVVLEVLDANGHPATFLVRVKNNAPATAVKADVEEKGKIPIDVSVVVCTLNVISGLLNNVACDTAIKRRFDVVFRPFVRPEFRVIPDVNQLDPSKVIAKYGTMNGVPEAWDFQIIEPRIVSVAKTQGNTDYFSRLNTFKESDMNRTDTKVEWTLLRTAGTIDTLNFLIDKAIKHKMVQEYVVESNTNLVDSIQVDVEGRCIKAEFGFSLQWADIANQYNNFSFYRLMCSLPRSWVDTPYVGSFMDLIFSRYLMAYFQRQAYLIVAYWCFAFSICFRLLLLSSNPFMFAFVGIVILQFARVFAQILRIARNKAYDEVLSSAYDLRRYTRIIYDYRVRCAGCVCVAAIGLYKFYQMYKAFYVQKESALDPQSKEEIEARLKSDNPWAGVEVAPPPISGKSKNMTFDQCLNICKKNLVHVSWFEREKRHFCDAFFLQSNFVLMPAHLLPTDTDVRVHFVRGDTTKINSSFDSYCGFADAVVIDNTDLAVVQVHNAPSFANLVHLLPERYDKSSRVVTEMHRDDIGIISYDTYRVRGEHVSNNAKGYGLPRFFGSMHTVNRQTFDGRCMATLVANAAAPYIFGFHLGGNGKVTGVCGQLTAPEAIAAIARVANVLPEASTGDFPEVICGKRIIVSPTVHPKCGSNFLPLGCNNTVCVYGSTIGASTPTSRVVPTIISKAVEDICGVPNKWGPPPFRAVRNHSVALQQIANNSCGFKPSSLKWAINDYVEPLIEKFHEWDLDIRPLTHMETVNGIPGRRFVDKIVRSTSIGFPRTGPKSEYMLELEPDPIYQEPVDLDGTTMEEVRRMEEAYLRGERAYSPAKTTLKDEPTDISKTKCRIFYVTNTALQYLIRKYFLSICAAYSTFPLLSGCAVGINRQGLEWEEMMKFVSHHGKDRIFAGDYSKFDLHMPCQIVRAAFECHIRIAKSFGYSERDIKIMNGIAADISNPILAFNGTLMEILSLHLSGTNLTVYNGSSANNLYVRIHYYEQTSGVVPFRENANMMSYGDDLDGSVHPRLDNFNNITFRDFLAEHGLVFTPPDKESEMTEFMDFDNTDFLKCVNRYDPDLGHDVAQLSEMSIFKSLHSVLKSNALSAEEAAGQNIDCALREWFFHGREKFDQRLAQMREVAKRCNITPYVKELGVDFDARVVRWKEKYCPMDLKPESGEEHVGDVTVVHEMCDYLNCTYPAEHECIFNNCSTDVGIQTFGPIKICYIVTAIPLLFYVMWTERLQFRLTRVNWSSAIFFTILFILEGPDAWLEQIWTYSTISFTFWIFKMNEA